MTAAPWGMPSPARGTARPARPTALIAGVLGCIALVAVVVSFPLGAMAHQLHGGGIQLLIAVPFMVVGLFNPLRRRVQHLVDRRFNRARYDADLIVAAFAARLQDATRPDSAETDLCATVQRALEPAHLSLWTWMGD
jgi:hypothetical protein